MMIAPVCESLSQFDATGMEHNFTLEQSKRGMKFITEKIIISIIMMTS